MRFEQIIAAVIRNFKNIEAGMNEFAGVLSVAVHTVLSLPQPLGKPTLLLLCHQTMRPATHGSDRYSMSRRDDRGWALSYPAAVLVLSRS